MSAYDMDPETRDGEILADLFDTLLQEILDGRTPDLATILPERPDLRERIAKTWALACSVAGRREPSRPVLAGYEIVRELGHGGMGTVYLARHQALQREVAIKVLPHSLAMSPRAKLRFLEEARSLARLRHDNVVHIHRIIDHAEMLAFEMEFVDGPSLRTLVQELAKRDKPQSLQGLAEVLRLPIEQLGARNTVEWFVRLGIRVARALGDVHRHGLVHRDVKPSNILMRANGQPVLADFGLAREGDLHATQAAFAGTPVYAAPERLRSGDADIDARADVYSLGVTLYEALTLGPSFGGTTTSEILQHIEDGNLPSLRKRAPNVSRDLETVITKAMEPDRRRRYATADEFADDLERLLSLQPIHARPAGPFRRAAKFVRRHQRVAIAAVAGAVVVAAVAFPVVAHARAAEGARERAAAAVVDARSHLLCAENLDSSWTVAPSVEHRQSLRTPEARAAQIARLDVALAAYDLALLESPEAFVQDERRAVAAVRSLVEQDERADADVVMPDTSGLPSLTTDLVRRAVARDTEATAPPLLATASPHDRFVAGLFAFLRNDDGVCRQCWQGVALDGDDQGFVDACLALQMAEDDQPERAYPQLFHAARAFPRATALAFAIADAAIAGGDLELAEKWLGSVPSAMDTGGTRTRHRLVQADIVAAKGDTDGARRLYRELVQTDPSNPEPLQRLAALAAAEGDHVTGKRLYEHIARRWPDLVLPRVQLARMALQRHDVVDYSTWARHVLGENLQRYSNGAAVQLASILRLGGLATLHAETLAGLDAAAAGWRDHDAIPLSSWLRPSQVRGIEQALRVLATFDRSLETSGLTDARRFAIELRAVWRTFLRLPRLSMALPGWLQVAVVGGVPLVLDRATELVAPLLLPFQRVLGAELFVYQQQRLFAKELADRDAAYGYQILPVGDTNGDALPEFCVSAPPANSRSGPGYLEIRNLGDGSLLDTWRSDDDECAFARSVASLGDVDGDLCTDIAIGAPVNVPWSEASASVTVRSGRTGQTLWTVVGESPSFGAALASLGDVDDDGIRDLVIGIPPMGLGFDQQGAAVVVSGKTGRTLRTLAADRSGIWFGGAVANAGDGNGDGFDDVLVAGNFGNAPGLVSMFNGRTGALLSTFADADTASWFGVTMVGLPDVDGDQLADLAIGAPAFGSRRASGAVHVISSRTRKTIYELRGEHGGDGFGYPICPLPDWRGRDDAALAVSSRGGGPSGGGYVRVFAAIDGQPLQTFASTVNVPFGYSLIDLGDRDRDGLRDLGVTLIGGDAAMVSIVGWADFLRSQKNK